jgi:two-component system OmpR family sensor kinase
VSNLVGGSTLALASSLRETVTTLDRLLMVELLVGLGVLVVAALSGAWLVGLGLRPLVQMQNAAETIAEENLTSRLPGGNDRTEVGRLARVLNTMLSRLETSFAERRASEDRLRLSEERLQQFVADASHELRTPIAAVRAYAELYRRRAGRNADDVPRMMHRVEDEATRLGVLVEDLLLLARLDEGRPLVRLPVDLGALAADAAEAARAVDPARSVDLRVEGLIEVAGDRNGLRQVLDNLLANVRTHTPPGSPAELSVLTEGPVAVVELADRGPGVAASERAQIFERFYRGDPSRTRDSGGAGLGLSIVTAIAEAHGGRVSIIDRAGGGAVFRLELPLLAEEALRN